MTIDYIKLDYSERRVKGVEGSGGQEAMCYWHLYWS